MSNATCQLSADKKKNKDICFNGLIIFLLVIVNILVYKGSNNGWKNQLDYRSIILAPYTILLIGSIALAFFAVLLRHRKKKKEEDTKGKIIFSWILWFVTPALMFVILEGIAGNLATIEKAYVLKNLAIFYILFLFFDVIFSRQSTAAAVYCSAMAVIGLVEYYVFSFRGRPFMIFDIWGVGTAAQVAGNYTYEISVKMGCWLLGTLFLLILHHYLQILCIPKKKWIGIGRIICIGAFMSLTLVLVKTDFMKRIGAESIELWQLNSNYQQKGSLYTLYLECQYVYIQKPEGYSTEKVEDIAEKAEKTETDTNGIQPENLIVIMNESLADFERLGTVNTDTELLPYLHSMKENTKKGWLQMPVMGGGTSDSEYEVLTGNTKQFLPMGTIAYEFYCGEPEYGMATSLKQQGYKTIALHPASPANWNRKKVYQEMGFDEFLSMENWGREIEFLREFPSDKSAYDKVIELIDKKESGEKLFTFLVTIQNHGGYAEETWGDFIPAVSVQSDLEYPQAEAYLSLANESDKAFEQLIKYFSNEEEPTMIVMFGDHFPGLSDGFYDTMERWNDPAMESHQRVYQTPYVIWANYEQESSSDGLISANYFGSYILEQAGVELTSYDKFLLNLKKTLPVIGMGAVCDNEGQWYSMEDLPEKYSSLLNEYKSLQYNNVVDRKKRRTQIFTVQ